MIAYILIYWIFGCYSCATQNSLTGQAVFGDQASCQAALQRIRDDFSAREPGGSPYGTAGGICAPSAQPAQTP